ncbi:MAG: hypothetical protein ABIT38_08025 [Gemmatimonadaceae bacterium]
MAIWYRPPNEAVSLSHPRVVMAFADLISARAVEQAVEEFNRLGRDAFLDKYGFGHAREDFLEIDGKRYDSMAIVGAAHGFQFPLVGALGSSDFSGGEATVRAKLESLGFNVVVHREGADGAATENTALHRLFHRRMMDIYKSAKADADYNSTAFLGLVNGKGGVEAARMLLRASDVSEGFTALVERNRLDLTVEAVILEDEWHTLFDESDRAIATQRLKQYGVSGHLPNG